MKKVLGIGNALTDILLQVSDKDIKELNLPKGSMNLISFDTAVDIQSRFASVRKTMVAGGSASNTITAISALGGKTAFIGKIGNDEIGDFYRNDIQKNNVKPILMPSSLMSGYCTALITPDGERTMCTYLGASADLSEDDIRAEHFTGYDIFHIEGYMLQSHELIKKALRLAKEAGLYVSLDLGSYNVVNENREFLHELINQYVDIVFANEDESFAYTHLSPFVGRSGYPPLCRNRDIGSRSRSGDCRYETSRGNLGRNTPSVCALQRFHAEIRKRQISYTL